MDEQIFARVQQVLAQVFERRREQITSSTYVVADLGADSIDIVELVLTLEEEFDLDIPFEDLEEVQDVNAQQIASYFTRKLQDED
ncbi:acyl carrier protein [Leptolyngbya sp. FACHB-261]|uniref:acyl carrier protein n=1 Tax=Leptolyngbya sp. FACHB-261 TaxID=2692806 RepID=UPI0016830D36|nr:acyl carrier protein [Leptolyngbya sp. FACHB-261]MBD2100883.1 acyl carrier protein [Leptolyngbya sp. FACHB-261]